MDGTRDQRTKNARDQGPSYPPSIQSLSYLKIQDWLFIYVRRNKKTPQVAHVSSFSILLINEGSKNITIFPYAT